MKTKKAKNGPKYPDIHVKLSMSDGNAYSIIANVRKGMRLAGLSNDEQDAFSKEATSGDYDHLLQTAMRWVDVT
jgi:hypothetical protein